MSLVSRRQFLTTAAIATVVSGRELPAQTRTASSRLRVQYTTGGHTVPLQQYDMFEDPLFADLDTWVVPHPHPFDRINGPDGPEVIVLGDWVGQSGAGWPVKDRPHMQKFLDAG